MSASDKTKLDTVTTLVGISETQTITGAKTFNDTTLLVRNPADTFSYTIKSSAVTAARQLILPLTTQTETLAIIPQTAQSSPTNPTGTTSATGVMMGLAGAITPRVTGKILVIISGNITNSAENISSVQIRTGTGAAPTNGAALTGTARGGLVRNQVTATGSTATMISPFSIQAIVSGLTVGTAVWLDTSLTASAGTATIANISITAFEL
jgi:hypothetical protein